MWGMVEIKEPRITLKFCPESKRMGLPCIERKEMMMTT